MPTYHELEGEYAALWAELEIKAEKMAAITATARKIISARSRYEAIESVTRVPWFVVGIIHAMEAQLRFDRHLHNGDPLTARTKLVPAGRPARGQAPFSFEVSACDALLMKHLDKVEAWTVTRIAYELERYNGWGYRRFHPETLSPYLWSGTCHYSRGKYVSDGKWSAAAISLQSGAMALLKRLAETEPSIRLDATVIDPAQDFHKTPEALDAPETMAQSSTGNTAVAVGAGGGVTAAHEVSTAFARLADTGKPLTSSDFLLALATSPTFWIGAFTVAAAVYIWIERRAKLVRYGV